MFEINPSNARQWSRIGSRGVFGQAILAVAEHHPELMVLSADLGNSSGLDRFKKTYPDQFLNVGIAEQNMVGVAAGLAKEGYNVFATSFAPFIAMRASEQVRMNLGYMGMNVKAVAIGSGVSMAFLGNSHYGIEDAAVMRAIPNITIVSPADCSEIFKTVEAAAQFEGPMYIRLTGAVGNPPVYDSDYSFKIGKAIFLRDPAQITFVAIGSMVHEALQAANLLAAKGLKVGVVNMHTLKPLDASALDLVLDKSELVITVEEHSVIGGLGSAVAEYKTRRKNSPPQLILGLPDAFGVTGEYRFLLERYGLTGGGICDSTLSYLSSKV
jgi:transketolase